MADRKAEALARLEEAKAKRLQAEESDAEERDIATIVRDAECEEQLALAIRDHGVGRVGALKAGADFLIFVTPSRPEYMRYIDSKGTKASEEMTRLAASSLYPKGIESTAKLQRLMDSYPGLLGRAGDLVTKLAGYRQGEDEGK